jgi:hypothetical protein
MPNMPNERAEITHLRVKQQTFVCSRVFAHQIHTSLFEKWVPINALATMFGFQLGARVCGGK